MDIIIKELSKENINRITEIDRSEMIRYKYVYKNGTLETIEINHKVPTWTPEMNEENIQMLTPILEKDGHFLAAFDRDKLVGVLYLVENL
ncbi:hypothetical protein J7E79_16910 [Bacillus sp. ISL-40]|uniref:hypothetical protein n=1 Tax=Bacillus sp. ISL-40 TaxID=2819126 RepID=UPI001BEBDF6F|nr:hypothetical protein [Bacillus sp. ISL-40]MBT2699072.1 hypothetical protein [Bacillus sp. ISL-40]